MEMYRFKKTPNTNKMKNKQTASYIIKRYLSFNIEISRNSVWPSLSSQMSGILEKCTCLYLQQNVLSYAPIQNDEWKCFCWYKLESYGETFTELPSHINYSYVDQLSSCDLLEIKKKNLFLHFFLLNFHHSKFEIATDFLIETDK